MRPRTIPIVGVLLLSVLAFGQNAHAMPFSFEYNDTVSNIGFNPIAGVSVGDPAQITVTLDNGNMTNLSQTWTDTDLQSVTFDFNNGGLVTTFSSPFDGGLFFASGNFETDAAGTLTSVMTNWRDLGVGADVTTSGSSTLFNWFLIGPSISNIRYSQFNPFSEIALTNAADMGNPANWSQVASDPIPEPSTMLLLGSGVVGLIGWRRWRAKRT